MAPPFSAFHSQTSLRVSGCLEFAGILGGHYGDVRPLTIWEMIAYSNMANPSSRTLTTSKLGHELLVAWSHPHASQLDVQHDPSWRVPTDQHSRRLDPNPNSESWGHRAFLEIAPPKSLAPDMRMNHHLPVSQFFPGPRSRLSSETPLCPPPDASGGSAPAVDFETRRATGSLDDLGNPASARKGPKE